MNRFFMWLVHLIDRRNANRLVVLMSVLGKSYVPGFELFQVLGSRIYSDLAQLRRLGLVTSRPIPGSSVQVRNRQVVRVEWGLVYFGQHLLELPLEMRRDHIKGLLRLDRLTRMNKDKRKGLSSK